MRIFGEGVRIGSARRAAIVMRLWIQRLCRVFVKLVA